MNTNPLKLAIRGQRWLISWKRYSVNIYKRLFDVAKVEQVTLFSLWRTTAHCESQNSMLQWCHGFKEIGSRFVCGAASIQPPHKEGETRRGLRESSLCGIEGKGWIKNCLGASVFSDPNWNYKCIWEMSYLWRAVPQAGLFFPVYLWWVSRTWSDKADRRAAIRWQPG